MHEWREHSQDGPIRAAAERYGVEPALVKAIVWQESRFNPNARGRAGELGLMQLQEIAAGEWADEERVAGYLHEHCLDPRTNTLAGTFYLAKVMRRYTRTDNPLPYALAVGLVGLFAGTLLVAYGHPWWAGMLLGLALLVAILFVLGRSVEPVAARAPAAAE